MANQGPSSVSSSSPAYSASTSRAYAAAAPLSPRSSSYTVSDDGGDFSRVVVDRVGRQALTAEQRQMQREGLKEEHTLAAEQLIKEAESALAIATQAKQKARATLGLFLAQECDKPGLFTKYKKDVAVFQSCLLNWDYKHAAGKLPLHIYGHFEAGQHVEHMAARLENDPAVTSSTLVAAYLDRPFAPTVGQHHIDDAKFIAALDKAVTDMIGTAEREGKRVKPQHLQVSAHLNLPPEDMTPRVKEILSANLEDLCLTVDYAGGSPRPPHAVGRVFSLLVNCGKEALLEQFVEEFQKNSSADPYVLREHVNVLREHVKNYQAAADKCDQAEAKHRAAHYEAAKLTDDYASKIADEDIDFVKASLLNTCTALSDSELTSQLLDQALKAMKAKTRANWIKSKHKLDAFLSQHLGVTPEFLENSNLNFNSEKETDALYPLLPPARQIELFDLVDDYRELTLVLSHLESLFPYGVQDFDALVAQYPAIGTALKELRKAQNEEMPKAVKDAQDARAAAVVRKAQAETQRRALNQLHQNSKAAFLSNLSQARGVHNPHDANGKEFSRDLIRQAVSYFTTKDSSLGQYVAANWRAFANKKVAEKEIQKADQVLQGQNEVLRPHLEQLSEAIFKTLEFVIESKVFSSADKAAAPQKAAAQAASSMEQKGDESKFEEKHFGPNSPQSFDWDLAQWDDGEESFIPGELSSIMRNFLDAPAIDEWNEGEENAIPSVVARELSEQELARARHLSQQHPSVASGLSQLEGAVKESDRRKASTFQQANERLSEARSQQARTETLNAQEKAIQQRSAQLKEQNSTLQKAVDKAETKRTEATAAYDNAKHAFAQLPAHEQTLDEHKKVHACHIALRTAKLAVEKARLEREQAGAERIKLRAVAKEIAKKLDAQQQQADNAMPLAAASVALAVAAASRPEVDAAKDRLFTTMVASERPSSERPASAALPSVDAQINALEEWYAEAKQKLQEDFERASRWKNQLLTQGSLKNSPANGLMLESAQSEIDESRAKLANLEQEFNAKMAQILSAQAPRSEGFSSSQSSSQCMIPSVGSLLSGFPHGNELEEEWGDEDDGREWGVEGSSKPSLPGIYTGIYTWTSSGLRPFGASAPADGIPVPFDPGSDYRTEDVVIAKPVRVPTPTPQPQERRALEGAQEEGYAPVYPNLPVNAEDAPQPDGESFDPFRDGEGDLQWND